MHANAVLDVDESLKILHHVWFGSAASWRKGPPEVPAVGGVLQRLTDSTCTVALITGFCNKIQHDE